MAKVITGEFFVFKKIYNVFATVFDSHRFHGKKIQPEIFNVAFNMENFNLGHISSSSPGDASG